jgi:hypothetical protein
VTDARPTIARVVEDHIDEIVERVLASYDAAVPRFKRMSERDRDPVREATRRTILSFLGLYAGDDRFARTGLDEARRVTLGRAGAIFDRDEIMAMISAARHVVFMSARELVQMEIGADPAREADINAALDAFLEELERPERSMADAGSALDRLLLDAESDEPDLA